MIDTLVGLALIAAALIWLAVAWYQHAGRECARMVAEAELLPLPQLDAPDAVFEAYARQAIAVANHAAFETTRRQIAALPTVETA